MYMEKLDGPNSVCLILIFLLCHLRYPGSGSMVSFICRGGALAADAVVSSARLIVHATSLGGVETTFERRAKYPGDSHIDPGTCFFSFLLVFWDLTHCELQDSFE